MSEGGETGMEECHMAVELRASAWSPTVSLKADSMASTACVFIRLY